MKKKKFPDVLDFLTEAKYSEHLPRCLCCKFHDEIEGLHYCNRYRTVTFPETLDMCSENDSFMEDYR